MAGANSRAAFSIGSELNIADAFRAIYIGIIGENGRIWSAQTLLASIAEALT